MKGVHVGWEETKLSEIAEVKLGRQRSPKNHTGPNMKPYVRAANVTWDGLSLGDVMRMNFSEEEFETYRLRSGDVLVAEASGSRSEVGKVAIWRDEIEGCCFQNTLIRVRSKGPLPEFLRWSLWYAAATRQLGEAARGVGIHHLGARTLAEWPVVVPPVNDQEAIVEEIEKQVTRLIAAETSLRQARRRVDLYASSILNGLIPGEGSLPTDWGWATPRELVKEERYSLAIGPFGSNLKVSDYTAAGVPLVFIRHVRSQNFDLNTPYVSHAKGEALKAHQVMPGDVLVTKMGDPPGDACVYPLDRPPAVMTADCIKLSPDPNLVSAEYLAYAIPSPVVRSQILAVTRGVAQRKISLGRFATVRIPMPPREEQDRIVAELDRQMSILTTLTEEIDQGFVKMRSLRNAILDSALSGKLRPRQAA